jgi:hypothetical protein
MRYVDITTEDALTTKNENTKQKIELRGVEVPQADSVEELTTMCGGQENLLALGNKLILATPASNVARAILRTAKAEEDVATRDGRARTAAHDYRPEAAQARGMPAKKAKEVIDGLRARLEAGETLSQDELVAFILGKASVSVEETAGATA